MAVMATCSTEGQGWGHWGAFPRGKGQGLCDAQDFENRLCCAIRSGRELVAESFESAVVGAVEGAGGPVGVESDHVERGGGESVLEADFRQAAVACPADAGDVEGLVDGALDAGAETVTAEWLQRRKEAPENQRKLWAAISDAPQDPHGPRRDRTAEKLMAQYWTSPPSTQ